MTIKQTKSITCDTCETELHVDTQYPSNYAIEVKSVDLGYNSSNCQYAVAMFPPIKSTMHFCNFKCLHSWVEEKI